MDRLHETLSDMHSMKVLGRFLPEFGAVSALVQHDLYHKYTVDEHSLLAVKKIQDIQTGEGMSYPEFSEAFRRVKDKQALMLAALLHDCGKAMGKGHSETGAQLAYKAAIRMGMEKDRADKVEFLIRNHLLMDHISKRRELSDRKVVEKFCRIVDSPELLDMLYILTYADISAVGPEMFNDWKMMLLKELHGSAMAFLKDEVSSLAFEKDRLAKLRAKIAAEAVSKGVGKKEEIMKFLDNLPPNYVLSVPVETALIHFSLSRGIRGGDIVLDHRHHDRGYTELTVILHDMMGLLYLTAGGLAAKGLNILSAQIFTGKNGIIIDTLQVTDYNKKPAEDERVWEDVKRGLVSLLRGQARVEDLMPRSHAYPKRTALKDVPVRVEVDNEASDKFTVVEVFAPDRVGLLYDITKELYNQGCQISSAKVDTEVDQIVDVFYVSDIFRHKLEDSDRIAALKDASAEGGKLINTRVTRVASLKKRAVFILLAIAVLVGGMDLFTRGEYFSGKIRSYVLDQAKQELGLDVGMDRLVFNFFPAYIDLKRPYVKGWDPKNPGRSVGAEKIRAYVGLSALLNKRIYIRRMQVYGISLDVARLPDGHLDIDPLRDKISELIKKKPKPGAYKVEVSEIVLFGARGSYSDAANKIFLSVGDAGVDFRMNGERYWTGFKFKDVAARVDGRPNVHASLEGDAEYAGGRINLQGVRLEAEGAKSRTLRPCDGRESAGA